MNSHFDQVLCMRRQLDTQTKEYESMRCNNRYLNSAGHHNVCNMCVMSRWGWGSCVFKPYWLNFKMKRINLWGLLPKKCFCEFGALTEVYCNKSITRTCFIFIDAEHNCWSNVKKHGTTEKKLWFRKSSSQTSEPPKFVELDNLWSYK